MPRLAEMLPPSCDTAGIYWHKPSQRFICHVGYHKVVVTDEDGFAVEKRVPSTQYLGTEGEEDACVAKFNELRVEWQQLVDEQRRLHDAEQARRRLLRQSPLSRFKPCWPTAAATEVAQPVVVRATAPRVSRSTSEGRDVLDLTLVEAKDQYLAAYKRRVGLLNGKGIKENSYVKHEQMLLLGLALNPTYNRDRRPINVRKRLRALTLADYEAFVRFWCDPANVKSGRTGVNYIRPFKQMIDSLKVPTPEGFDDLFKLKVKKKPNIARYDPRILKVFLNCDHERARLFSLLCLNCGYYAVDIVRLGFDHITDFEGNPYIGGEMFITKCRERTSHQNDFTTTCFVWPETQTLMETYKACPNPYGVYFLSAHGAPYNEDTVSGLIDEVKRANNLQGQFSVKQFRKVGASQIKALADSDAMHMYKANAVLAVDQPYILDDFSRLTAALKKFREKLIADGVLKGEA